MSKEKYVKVVQTLFDGNVIEVAHTDLHSGEFNLSSLRSALSREIRSTADELLPAARSLKTRTVFGPGGQRKLRLWLVEDEDTLCYTVVSNTRDESRGTEISTTLGKTEI